MDIREEMKKNGIECDTAACCSITEYVCRNTTPEIVNAILKRIGVYEDYRAIRPDDYKGTVYINRLYRNGKSWD